MSSARKNSSYGKTKGATIRKKRKNTSDTIISSHDRRKWEELPQELLEIIFNKNKSRIVDYLNFGRVCRSWRSCNLESRQVYFESHSPFAIYISNRASRHCYFYNITTRIRYKTKLPNFAETTFLGISSGYLIMKPPKNPFMWLVNPVTGHQLQVRRTPESNPLCCADHAIFASVGSDRDLDFLVVVRSRVHKNLQFCKVRDNQWKQYSFLGKPWTVMDITVFEGKIFAITSESQIGILDLKSSDLVFLKLKNAPRLRDYMVKFVASNEQLFVVDLNIQVYRIDFSGMEWVTVSNLGDQALFIGGKMSCRASNATKWGGRSNCLYYLRALSHLCSVYSLDGQIMTDIPIAKGYFSPLVNCWYFLDQSSTIDNVKDD